MNKKVWAGIALIALLALSALVYLITDFHVNEANIAANCFAIVQLLLSACLFAANTASSRSPKTKFRIMAIIYLSIALIQLPPILFWILFNGSLINEILSDGIRGNWIYSLFHIFVFIWCVAGVFLSRSKGDVE